MFVSEILHKKQHRVFTIRPGAYIKFATNLFMEHKIGALPVCEVGGKILGLLTERDVLHGIATNGAEALEFKVEQLMSGKAHTCKMDDKIQSVMVVMNSRHVRHVLVVDGDELKGIVSIGDIMRNRVDETQLEVDVLRDYARIH